MLAEFIKKCKLKLKPYEQDVILVIIIILVALISFGLGRLSKIGESRVPITIENLSTTTPAEKITDNKIMGNYVASKTALNTIIPGAQAPRVLKKKTKFGFPQPKKLAKPAMNPPQIVKG
jgi:hypothetical protein